MSEWKYEHRHFLRKQPPALEAIPFEDELPPLEARVNFPTGWVLLTVAGLLVAIGWLA